MQRVGVVMESVVILLLLSIVLWQQYHRPFKRWWPRGRAKPKRPWTLQARQPNDCQDCRIAGSEVGPGRRQARRPWSEVKSQRGRPKVHDSSGQACMNSLCGYYKNTDPNFHALRWDGQRNACEATDQWECGACERKHTARLGTPMYRLKTSSEQVALATHLAMI